jgi:hypothetical protein
MPRLTRLLRSAAALFVTGAAIASMGQATKGATDHTDSRIDIYGGYGYWHPINSGINGFQYQDVSNPNATVSVSGWFNKYAGLQIEGGYFSGNGEHRIYNAQIATPCSGENCSQLVYTAEAGPIFRLPLGSFVPFIHALGGGEGVNGPVNQNLFWGWGVTAGAGLDIVTPYFHHALAIRPIQADWQYSQVVYGPLQLPGGTSGGFGEIDALKVSAGLVLRIGEARDKPPVMLGCAVQPVSGFPGDAMQVNATTLNTDPRRKPVITWTTNGGRVIGGGLNPALDTAGMKPGDYILQGKYVEGTRNRQQASCEAPFTIRPFEPPTITCVATPNVALSGTDISISTSASSPQNRPLTYSYSATAGQLTSNGPTATLATAGLSEQTITITCNVVDDQGQSAQSTTTARINVPAPPPAPNTQPLCTIGFDRDKRRPARVDNEGKACLDDIALTLNRETDSKLVMVGNFAAPETENMAAERTLNAQQYLTKEKGIDPSRIELRIGTGAGRSINDTLVPSGATFDAAGTHTFDTAKIVRKGPAYGIPKPKPADKPKPAAPTPATTSPSPAAPAPSTKPATKTAKKPAKKTPVKPASKPAAGTPSPQPTPPTSNSAPGPKPTAKN